VIIMPNNIRGNIDTLPGPYSIYGDGNLGRLDNASNPPRIVLMGSAEKGNDYQPQAFTEDNIDTMLSVFGAKGDLLQQVQEMQTKGGNAALAVRIGARPVFAMHIGASGLAAATPTDQEDGYWIESFYGGKEFGTRFGVAWEKASDRLIIEDKLTGVVVFDNLSTNPIDLGLVFVRGQSGTTAGDEGTDIGTISPLATVAMNSLSTTDGRVVSYVGDDGTSLSRMALFEGVMRAFTALEGFRYDYVPLPPAATLDAPVDYGLAATAAVGTAYPARGAAGAAPDKLGQVYIEFVDDKLEFYWDVDGDAEAEYWSVSDTASYSATSKGGHVFTSTSWEEPNFAYALGYHCQRTTFESHFVQGIVGVERPPLGKPLSTWIGVKPVYSTAQDGLVTVTTDGTGLLGSKYLGGKTTFRNAAAYGGFVETSEPYFDSGTEQLDPNDQPVDMGKFLSVWITPEIFQPALGVRNNQAYIAISPAAYAGFRDGLSISESPTNKAYAARRGVLTGRLTRSQQADLTEMRYTFAKEDFNGIKVVDGPSASLPTSDYTRQGTIEIVQYVDTVLRTIADPFIGRNISAEEEVALQKELEEGMNGLVGSRIIRAGVAKLVITPEDRILGQGNVAVSIEAPFELQRIFFTVNLTKGN
jgi:hypothetical protein